MSPNSKVNENNQPNQGNEQPFFNPWGMFPSPPPMNDYNSQQPIQQPRQQPQYQPRQQPQQSKQQEQAPNQMPFNPWSVFPALQQHQPIEQEQNSNNKTDTSGLSVQVVKDNVGKIINTSISGYGRINVHVKNVERNGMVHLVLLDTKPSDYIYIHNSDMDGIYPPIF